MRIQASVIGHHWCLVIWKIVHWWPTGRCIGRSTNGNDLDSIGRSTNGSTAKVTGDPPMGHHWWHWWPIGGRPMNLPMNRPMHWTMNRPMNRPLDHHHLSQVAPAIVFTSGTNGATTRNIEGRIFQGLQAASALQSLTTAPQLRSNWPDSSTLPTWTNL